MTVKKAFQSFVNMLETTILDRTVVEMESSGANCDSLKFTFIVPEDDKREIAKHCRNHGYKLIETQGSIKTSVYVPISAVFSMATQPKRILPVKTQSQARQKGLCSFFYGKIKPDNIGVK